MDAKRQARLANLTNTDCLWSAYNSGEATFAEKLELYHLGLATRLLRVKYNGSPAYSNEELAAFIGISATHLTNLMNRTRESPWETCSKIEEALEKLELMEGCPAIPVVPHPGK